MPSTNLTQHQIDRARGALTFLENTWLRSGERDTDMLLAAGDEVANALADIIGFDRFANSRNPERL